MNVPQLYLASQSPRRQQLLAQWGVGQLPLLPGPEEDAEALEVVLPHEGAQAYVTRVVGLKLGAALARMHARGLAPLPVLCADTTVVLGRRIMGKPADAAEATEMLGALSGRRHRVLTALALGRQPDPTQAPEVWTGLSVSVLAFAPLSPALIARYVASGEPMGKAGAYAIQGRAALWVQRMNGSYSGIMGLPAHETALVLGAAGIAID